MEQAEQSRTTNADNVLKLRSGIRESRGMEGVIREFRRYNWNIQSGQGVQETMSGSQGEWAVRSETGNLDDIIGIYSRGREYRRE